MSLVGSPFLQELGHFLRHHLRPVVNHQRAVEIAPVVDAVLNFVAVAVKLSRLGTVAFNIAVDVNLDDFVRCQEAVLDALFERVGINRLNESSGCWRCTRFPWEWR